MKRHTRCRYSSRGGIALDPAHPRLPLRAHLLGPQPPIAFEDVAVVDRGAPEVLASDRGLAYLPREVPDDHGVGRGTGSAESPRVLRMCPGRQPAEHDLKRPPAGEPARSLAGRGV